MGSERLINKIRVTAIERGDSMQKDITYLIVKGLIADMLGRYRIDALIGNANNRNQINVQVGMFEKWRGIVSEELLRSGLIEKGYSPINDEKLKSKTLSDILKLREFYLTSRDEEEK